MARPKSLYELKTDAVIPPPDLREKRHTVIEGEDLIGIGNREYALLEYDPNLWRLIADTNGITNPFTFDETLRGQALRIPPRPLPDFVD